MTEDYERGYQDAKRDILAMLSRKVWQCPVGSRKIGPFRTGMTEREWHYAVSPVIDCDVMDRIREGEHREDREKREKRELAAQMLRAGGKEPGQ